MLEGRFGDTSGRPFLEGLVIFPRLGIQQHISFLVDTGADYSIIMNDDSSIMGLDWRNLQRSPDPCYGIGGESFNYVEPARLVFTDSSGSKLYAYTLDLDISEAIPGHQSLPSLLGRDIIDRWRMTYEAASDTLHFDVRDADEIIDVV